MNIKDTFRVLSCTALAVSCALSSEIVAQDADTNAESDESVVTITGSRIKRKQLVSSSPVTVLDQEAIAQSGVSSVGELLVELPSVVGSPGTPRSGGNNNGIATVRLRGLSSNNTLVLVNGRRVSTRGVSSAVDLETIPFDAVERVEVLKDGASAVYGSDAIAGVVNIIMRDGYDGLTLKTEYGESTHGDAAQTKVGLTWGGSTEKSSWIVSASRFSDDGWMRRDRDISSDADLRRFGATGTNLRSSKSPHSWIFSTDYSSLGVTANTGASWDPANGYDAANDFRSFNGFWGSAPGDAASCDLSTQCDSFNYHDFETGSNDYKTTTIWVSGEYEISDTVTAFMQYNAADIRSTNFFAPGAIEFGDNVIVSENNIYNPFGQDVVVQRRITENGILRPLVADSDVDRFTFGLQGSLVDWDWDLAYSSQESKVIETRGTQMSLERIRHAAGDSDDCLARSDGCVPLDLIGPFGAINQEMIDYIFYHKPTSIYDNNLRYITANITGAVAELPAGELMIAAGAEFRWQDAQIVHDAGRNSGDIAFVEAVADTFAPTRKIKEYYIEASAPLLKDAAAAKSLDLELAVRFSDYNDFGSTSNPKLGLRWAINDDLMIRYSYSEGFRAPTLGELYTPSARGFVNDTDPCTTDAWSTLAGCTVRAPGDLGYTALTGGNPNLQPEEAESFTAGFVWTPSFFEGFELTADIWKIEQTNVVDTYGATRKVRDNAENPALWADTVIRNPNSGALVVVMDVFENIDGRELSGWDVEAKYSWQTEGNGEFVSQLGISNLSEWIDIEERDGVVSRSDIAGVVTGGASFPEIKINGSLNWKLNDLSATWLVSHIDELIDTDNDVVENPKVDAYWKHSLQLGYQLAEWQTQLTFGIDNIFDEDPPILASTVDGGHDPDTYSARGRFFYVRASIDF